MHHLGAVRVSLSIFDSSDIMRRSLLSGLTKFYRHFILPTWNYLPPQAADILLVKMEPRPHHMHTWEGLKQIWVHLPFLLCV